MKVDAARKKHFAKPDFFHCDTFHGVDLEHLFDQTRDTNRQKSGNPILTAEYLSIQIWNVRVFKWKAIADERVQDDSTTPHIDFWAAVQPVCVRESLFRNIRQSKTHSPDTTSGAA